MLVAHIQRYMQWVRVRRASIRFSVENHYNSGTQSRSLNWQTRRRCELFVHGLGWSMADVWRRGGPRATQAGRDGETTSPPCRR
jgi:hypothetical protein